jgi:FkbM family methyltransferase
MILLSRIILGITHHPLNKGHKLRAVLRFLRWQIGIRILPFPVIYSFIEGIKFIAFKGLTAATGNIYSGLFEYEDMLFLIHFLENEDLFFDVGANIGTHTLLASGISHARSVCFEPTPSTFEILTSNIKLNHLEESVICLQAGVGDQAGSIAFSTSADSETNHVAYTSDDNAISVPLTTIDLAAKRYGAPVFVKIDVEGYESKVLEGMKSTLQDNKLKVMLVELNGSANAFGIDENDIHRQIVVAGFLPYEYDPVHRSFKRLQDHGSHNTLYIRDYDFVTNRIRYARKIRVLGKDY